MVFNLLKEFIDVVLQIIRLHSIPFITQLYQYLRYGKAAAVEYRQKTFAKFISQFTNEYNEKSKEHKMALFKEIQGRKRLRILEIGIGAGSNLCFYPSQCSLTAVEPNGHFEEHLRKNLEKYPGIKLEKFYKLYGENMKDIPSESFDVVVTALVNCSVQNITQLLQEITRVLTPGGKYYFIEHCLDFDKSSWRFWVQNMLTTLRIWPSLFDGCEFRNLEKSVIDSQYFSTVTSTKFYINSAGLWVYKFIAPHVSGVATK